MPGSSLPLPDSAGPSSAVPSRLSVRSATLVRWKERANGGRATRVREPRAVLLKEGSVVRQHLDTVVAWSVALLALFHGAWVSRLSANHNRTLLG